MLPSSAYSQSEVSDFSALQGTCAICCQGCTLQRTVCELVLGHLPLGFFGHWIIPIEIGGPSILRRVFAFYAPQCACGGDAEKEKAQRRGDTPLHLIMHSEMVVERSGLLGLVIAVKYMITVAYY